MINFTSRTKYFISSKPTDMRNGREVIFYSKDYRKVKILHYDLNGYVMYQKWFDNGKFLKPEFAKILNCHEISRETLILLLSTAIQTKIAI